MGLQILEHEAFASHLIGLIGASGLCSTLHVPCDFQSKWQCFLPWQAFHGRLMNLSGAQKVCIWTIWIGDLDGVWKLSPKEARPWILMWFWTRRLGFQDGVGSLFGLKPWNRHTVASWQSYLIASAIRCPSLIFMKSTCSLAEALFGFQRVPTCQGPPMKPVLCLFQLEVWGSWSAATLQWCLHHLWARSLPVRTHRPHLHHTTLEHGVWKILTVWPWNTIHWPACI